MNQATEKLVSLEMEKSFLGGLFRNPDVVYETETFLKETDFNNKLNQTIFIVCRNLILDGQELSKTIVAQKVKELNISFKDPISPFDYIDSITLTPITAQATINSAKELVKLRIRRDIYGDAQDVANYILSRDCSQDSIAKIISNVDSIFNRRISSITTEEEPVDLYSRIEQYLIEIAKNPAEEVGLITPFHHFNEYFGGLRSRNGMYNIISRSGEGKSTFLFNMAKGVALLNNCPVLYLDTEMSLDLNMLRAAAAESGINPWFLESGKWANNTDFSKKVLQSFKEFNKYKGKVFHKTCPNMSIAETIGVIRKWFFKHVGRGNPCLVIYDYLKITSDVNINRQEWQQLGDKVSYLNETGYQFDIHLWSAGQQNRSAEQAGMRLDDSTTAAASDRINQYVCFNSIFREKTLDEITDHGIEYGTHLLKPFKTSRTQGENSWYKNRRVRIVDRRNNRVTYFPNFINYQINEFDVKECGTYAKIVQDQELRRDLIEDHEDDNNNDVDV